MDTTEKTCATCFYLAEDLKDCFDRCSECLREGDTLPFWEPADEEQDVF